MHHITVETIYSDLSLTLIGIEIEPLEFERKNFSVSLAYYRAIIIGGIGKYMKDL